MPELTALQSDVLEALRKKGGKAMVYELVKDGLLPPGRSIGYGVALSWLERKGFVESWYPSVESAGVAKVWALVERRG